MSKPAVGFIGVGMMGSGMAGRLLAAGHPVTLLAHRNRAPLEPLLARGARAATAPSALVSDTDALFTCLPNADVVGALADEITPLFRPGQFWIDTSTSRPETSEAIAAHLAEKGAIFADAPVTGGPPEAEAGTLASLVGCRESDYPRIEALVGTYSKTIRRLGDPGRGHAAKLLNNLVSQGTMLLLADAYQCAARIGVDPEALYGAMMGGAARSGTLQKAVAPALTGDFSGARFTIANAAKDLAYVRDLLEQALPDRAPTAALLAARLARLTDEGRGADFVSTMLDPNG